MTDETTTTTETMTMPRASLDILLHALAKIATTWRTENEQRDIAKALAAFLAAARERQVND